MRCLCALSLFSLVVGCVAAKEEVGTRNDFVVYGNDDRVEVYQHPDPVWRELAARSIVALVSSNILDTSNPSDVRFRGQNLQQARSLCPSERFLEQPAIANCSGTLIDLDLVLTAGHCVTSQAQCEGTSFVFDYLYEEDGPRKEIDLNEDVYGCSELVTQQLVGGLDYAVVRLDRVVHEEHGPAPVRMGDQRLTLGTGLVVMGFGSGIPLKIDDGGQVINERAGSRDWFGANVDTFGGHSGSGVFNDAGEVVGVLVRGEGDYEYSQGCGRVRVLPDNPADGIEEECTYVARAIEALCEVTSSVVCEGSGICRACRTDSECGDLVCDDGACLPSCALGEECPGGTMCSATGLCQPEVEFRCEGADVVQTRCGRAQDIIETCAGATFCDAGACVPLPPGDSCAMPIEIAAVNQTLTGEHVLETTNTGGGTCGGSGRDTIYSFELEDETRMIARGHNQDAVLHLRSECGSQESEIACNDDAEGPVRTDSLLDETLPPGRYFLFMDNFSRRNGGEYELSLEFYGPMDDAGPRFDAGAEDVVVVPFPDAGPGPDLDAGPGFDSGPGFDTGPGFDVGPRADAGPPVEVQHLKWGCDCGVENTRRSPPLALLLFAGLFVMRRRRLS